VSSTPMREQLPTAVEQRRLYRRALAVVVVSQVFGGAGLAAGVTVGALLAQDMLGGHGTAGIPAALFTLGSALAAFTVGRVSQRRGRRAGLAAGFLVGALGAVGIVVAAATGNPFLLFPALFVYGSGTATNLQARYAGTDLASPHSRGTAVSIALVATTFGAVAGPNLVDQLGMLAESLGLPALAGPFLLAAVAYGLASLVLALFLRPDPLLLARRLAEAAPDEPLASSEVSEQRFPPSDNRRGIALGATIMVLTQVAMVVIGVHIGAMFLPSLITGPLVDRVGRVPMAVASATTLLAAGLVAALAPGESLTWLTVALALLGLGWNFGLISGTALIVDSTAPQSRAQTQGSIDVLIAIAGAGGGAVSGVVMGLTSFAILSLAGGVLALLLIPVVVWHRRPAPADSPPADVVQR